MATNNKQQATEQEVTKDQRRLENHNRDADGMRQALLGRRSLLCSQMEKVLPAFCEGSARTRSWLSAMALTCLSTNTAFVMYAWRKAMKYDHISEERAGRISRTG
jgi:hypothetical protein